MPPRSGWTAASMGSAWMSPISSCTTRVARQSALRPSQPGQALLAAASALQSDAAREPGVRGAPARACWIAIRSAWPWPKSPATIRWGRWWSTRTARTAITRPTASSFCASPSAPLHVRRVGGADAGGVGECLAVLGVQQPRRGAGGVALERSARPRRRRSHKLLMTLLVSLRGTLFIYQGEELGLAAGRCAVRAPAGSRGKDLLAPDTRAATAAGHPCRGGPARRMPAFRTASPGCRWTPPTRRSPSTGRRPTAASTLNFTRALLAWRKRHGSLVTGDIRFLDTSEPVLAFERSIPGERILCVFNLGADPAQAALSVEGSPTPLDGPRLPVSPGGFLDGDHVSLPGYGAVFATLV